MLVRKGGWIVSLEKRNTEQRKARAQARLQATFVDRLASDLEALVVMLSDTEDGDAIQAIRDELQRLADTAKALQLVPVGEAIESAAMHLASDELDPAQIVDGVLAATGVKRRFAPIAIVADGPLLAQLERQIVSVCEPIHLFPTMEALNAHPGRSGFQAER